MVNMLTPPPRFSRSELVALMNTRAGCVLLAYSRRTGALRGVYRSADAELDEDSGKWHVVCETHSTCVGVDTRAQAEASDTNDFCDECRDRVGG